MPLDKSIPLLRLFRRRLKSAGAREAFQTCFKILSPAVPLEMIVTLSHAIAADSAGCIERKVAFDGMAPLRSRIAGQASQDGSHATV
jgi:hypothetical protein